MIWIQICIMMNPPPPQHPPVGSSLVKIFLFFCLCAAHLWRMIQLGALTPNPNNYVPAAITNMSNRWAVWLRCGRRWWISLLNDSAPVSGSTCDQCFQAHWDSLLWLNCLGSSQFCAWPRLLGTLFWLTLYRLLSQIFSKLHITFSVQPQSKQIWSALFHPWTVTLERKSKYALPLGPLMWMVAEPRECTGLRHKAENKGKMIEIKPACAFFYLQKYFFLKVSSTFFSANLEVSVLEWHPMGCSIMFPH